MTQCLRAICGMMELRYAGTPSDSFPPIPIDQYGFSALHPGSVRIAAGKLTVTSVECHKGTLVDIACVEREQLNRISYVDALHGEE